MKLAPLFALLAASVFGNGFLAPLPKPIGPDSAIVVYDGKTARLVSYFQSPGHGVRLDSLLVERRDSTAGEVHLNLVAVWSAGPDVAAVTHSRRIDRVVLPTGIDPRLWGYRIDSLVSREYFLPPTNGNCLVGGVPVNCQSAPIAVTHSMPITRAIDDRFHFWLDCMCAVYDRPLTPVAALGQLVRMLRDRPYPVIAEIPSVAFSSHRQPAQIVGMPYPDLPLPGFAADAIWQETQQVDLVEVLRPWPTTPRSWTVPVGPVGYDAVSDGADLALPDDSGSAVVGNLWTSGLNTRFQKPWMCNLARLPAAGTRWLGFFKVPDSGVLEVFGEYECGSPYSFRVVNDSVLVGGVFLPLAQVRSALAVASKVVRASAAQAELRVGRSGPVLALHLASGESARARLMDASGKTLWTRTSLRTGEIELPSQASPAWLRVEGAGWSRVLSVGPR